MLRSANISYSIAVVTEFGTLNIAEETA